MSHLFLTDISKEHGVDERGLSESGLAGQHQVEAETPLHCSSVHLQPGIQFELGLSPFVHLIWQLTEADVVTGFELCCVQLDLLSQLHKAWRGPQTAL